MHISRKSLARIIIIVLVASVLVGVGWFVWGRQDTKNDRADAPLEAKSSTTAKVTKKVEATEVITEVDLLLQHPGDESLLPSEAPATFIEYMTTRLKDFDCDFNENPNAGFSITKISPRFVSGSINGCLGGAATVWYQTTEGWDELGYQSHVPCSRLEGLAIPSDFLSECYNDSSPGEEIIANPNGPLN